VHQPAGIGGHRRYATVNCHEKAVDTAAGIWPGQSAHRPSDEEWSGAGSDADLPLFSHCVDVGVPDPQLTMSGCSAIVALRLTLIDPLLVVLVSVRMLVQGR
jgi:hypothetical protein